MLAALQCVQEGPKTTVVLLDFSQAARPLLSSGVAANHFAFIRTGIIAICLGAFKGSHLAEHKPGYVEITCCDPQSFRPWRHDDLQHAVELLGLPLDEWKLGP